MAASSPHRKKVKHFHETGHLHELTFSCYRRMPLLTNDDWRRRLARCLDVAGQEESIRLVAFVFMPTHVHLLTLPLSDSPNVSRYLARIKQPLSKQVREQLGVGRSRLLDKLTVRERPGKSSFRFWQQGSGYDRNLFTPSAIEASIDYIHANPVCADLCGRAVDWKWSSARYYIGDPPKQQYADLPRVECLPPDAFEESVS